MALKMRHLQLPKQSDRHEAMAATAALWPDQRFQMMQAKAIHLSAPKKARMARRVNANKCKAE